MCSQQAIYSIFSPNYYTTGANCVDCVFSLTSNKMWERKKYVKYVKETFFLKEPHGSCEMTFILYFLKSFLAVQSWLCEIDHHIKLIK